MSWLVWKLRSSRRVKSQLTQMPPPPPIRSHCASLSRLSPSKQNATSTLSSPRGEKQLGEPARRAFGRADLGLLRVLSLYTHSNQATKPLTLGLLSHQSPARRRSPHSVEQFVTWGQGLKTGEAPDNRLEGPSHFVPSPQLPCSQQGMTQGGRDEAYHRDTCTHLPQSSFHGATTTHTLQC